MRVPHRTELKPFDLGAPGFHSVRNSGTNEMGVTAHEQ